MDNTRHHCRRHHQLKLISSGATRTEPCSRRSSSDTDLPRPRIASHAAARAAPRCMHASFGPPPPGVTRTFRAERLPAQSVPNKQTRCSLQYILVFVKVASCDRQPCILHIPSLSRFHRRHRHRHRQYRLRLADRSSPIYKHLPKKDHHGG